MPRFPLLDQLSLPATFVRYVPGRLHPDGRRYLPLLIFALASGTQLGVIDRHHLIAADLEGQQGETRLVFLLSTIRLQRQGEQRYDLVPEPNLGDRPSMAPEVYGRVVEVPTWEAQHGVLQHESLYTELLLDIGIGVVGVRTAMTAHTLSQSLGTERIVPGDWLHVGRSRVDILGFAVTEEHKAIG